MTVPAPPSAASPSWVVWAMALSMTACGQKPDPALAETVRRLEIRISALEWQAQRGLLKPAEQKSSPIPPKEAESPKDPTPPSADPSPLRPPETPPPQTPPPIKEDTGTLSGTLVLSGPYAQVGGRGVVLLSPLFDQGNHHKSPRPKKAKMEQRDRDFVPRLLALPLGSTVSFPNLDPVFHNVFSLSQAKPFDLGVFKQGESRDVVFDKPGVIQVLCNLHANMSAYLIIYKEPYAALVDSKGRFAFPDLPQGRYRLVAWHERASEPVRKEVQVQPGPAGAERIQIPIRADQAPLTPPNKEGKPRGSSAPQRNPPG